MTTFTSPTPTRGTVRLPSSWWSKRHITVAVLGVFGLAASLIGYHTLQVTEWLVMTDEMQYAKLALAIGEDLSLIPRLHGAYYASHSQLYPLLIAPFFQLFDVPDAFRAIHAWNAVLMSSACFPAYVLARDIVRNRPLAVVTAALSVAVPWMALSTMLLTDVAAYPAFLWAVVAVQWAVARRGTWPDLLALVAITIAVAARTQFIVLAAVFPVAVLAHELLYAWHGNQRHSGLRALVGGLRRAISGHPLLFVMVALSPLLYATLGTVAGNYAGIVSGLSFDAPGLGLAAVRHLDVVVVATGALPFVLSLAFAIDELRRPSSAERHAFAVLLAVLTPVLLLIVAYFVVRFAVADRLYDRYLFYLAPLLFVGMAAQLAGGRGRVTSLALAGIASVALIGVMPFTTPPFVITPETPASAFHRVLDGRSWQLGQVLGMSDLQPRPVIITAVVLAVAVLALAQRHLPARVVAPAVCLLVLAFNLAETRYVFQAMLASQIGAPPGQELPLDRRDWIDRAVPDNASVALIPSTAFDAFTTGRIWWEAEFWNATVDRTFAYGETGPWTPWNVGRTIVTDEAGGRMKSSEPPGSAPTPFLVVGPYETRFRPASRTIARTPGGMKLLRAELPYRAEWVTSRLASDGWIVQGSPATVRVFGPSGGRPRAIRLDVTFDLPAYPPRPPRFVLASAGVRRTGTLEALAKRSASVEVCVAPGETAEVEISGRGKVSLPDGRKPAVHVLSIDSEPGRRRCRG